MDDVEHLKDQARFVWAQGDYPQVARFILPAAVHLVEASGIQPGDQVLDVGAGDGNVAITAASKGARVVASDLTPQLVEKGRRRTAEAGLEIEWQEADAEDLPFEDDRFDVVTSNFAAIFAPRAAHTAKELMRVTRPGGLVAMTAWAQKGFVRDSMLLGQKFGPPQEPGVDTPMTWGDPDTARERFLPVSEHVEVKTGHVYWRFDSVQEWMEWGEANIPAIVVAKRMMEPNDYASMKEASASIAESYNQATDGTMDLPAEYLLVLARKPKQH